MSGEEKDDFVKIGSADVGESKVTDLSSAVLSEGSAGSPAHVIGHNYATAYLGTGRHTLLKIGSRRYKRWEAFVALRDSFDPKIYNGGGSTGNTICTLIAAKIYKVDEAWKGTQAGIRKQKAADWKIAKNYNFDLRRILYYLDKEGGFSFKRNFDSLTNNDWEDLASDKDFLYIADMGNNFDTRKNLQIVKVPIDPKINNTEFINFYYPEQSEFEFRLSSMYDAEGLISIDDYLLIFTKNRAKKITDIYKISKTPGSQIAEKIGSLDCQSIVTGADYNKDLKLLVLTATVSFEEYYILKLKDFDPKKPINYQIDMYEIPLEKTQVESIKIIDKNTFWITSEAETFGSPYLFKISL